MAPKRIIPIIIHIHHFVNINFFGSPIGNEEIEGFEGSFGFIGGFGFTGVGLVIRGFFGVGFTGVERGRDFGFDGCGRRVGCLGGV